MKKIIVTGSEGLIGRELVELLEKDGNEVLKIDIKRFWNRGENCLECGWQHKKIPMDVRDYSLMKEIFEIFKPDEVYHLFGVKGNPKMTKEQPASFMLPMLQGDTNIIRIVTDLKIKKVLYTSSIAVNNINTDYYPAWAKLTSEKLIKAIKWQFGKNAPNFIIVRPANVYGRYDNFNNPNAMVITSLITRAIKKQKIELFNGGENIRDFINAKDVARGMILAMNSNAKTPLNLCSGEGIAIKRVAEIIANYLNVPVVNVISQNKQMGNKIKVMKLNWDFKPEISLEEGIKEACDYAKKILA